MNGDYMAPRCPVWMRPEAFPPLGDRHVHVWRVHMKSLENDPPDFESLLDAAERDRAARFLVAAPRRQFMLARGILRHLLARYLNREAGSFHFAVGDQGKPYLSAEGAAGLRFNVSHSGDVILLAFSRGREVGVDVERIHALQTGKEIAERFFTSAEAYRIQELPETQREQAFFHHWVRKEAFVKAVGKGIASGLSHEVEVLARADELPPADCCVVEPYTESSWRLFSLEMGPQYLGALSAAGNDWIPVFWQWQ